MSLTRPTSNTRNRSALAALCLALVAGAAGCAEAVADPPRTVVPVATQWPASVAGGACELLDYGTIEAALKVRFDVAAASRQGKTSTCVVRDSKASQPELMLAVTSTTVDATIFRATMVPGRAQKLTGLGKAAYQASLPASKTDGPAAEVGWLAGDKRLIVLRFTFPPGANPAEVSTLATPLIDLAKQVDKVKISA